MIIRQIRLNNIRTYTDTIIDFDKGITLLSGDVGAGKSTLLFAAEFALFGLQRGDLTGNMLLRNGEDKGFVELRFESGDKEFIIKRMLRRNSGSVVQDGGFFASDNGLEKLTSNELKSKVLEILNYPQEMVTKKSLIFRYTVYAVQEEMKSILLGSGEDRKDTLRRVFNIDKYRTIRTNMKFFLSELRSRIKNMKFKKEELEKQIENKTEIEGRLRILEKKLEEFNLSKYYEDLNVMNRKYSYFKEKKEFLDKISIENVKLKSEIESCTDSLKKYKGELDTINEIIDSFTDMSFDGDEIKLQLKKYEGNINNVEEALESINITLSEANFKIKSSEKVIKKISEISKCPTCLQDVSVHYKDKIINYERRNIFECTNSLKKFDEKKNDLTKTINYYKVQLEVFRKKLEEFKIFKVKKENYDLNLNRKNIIKKEINSIDEKKSSLETKLENINNKLKSFENLQDEAIILKNEIEIMNNKIKNLEIEKKGVEKEKEILEHDFTKFEKLSNEIDSVSLKLVETEKVYNWINTRFSEMVENIEKDIMAQIYNVFNSNFVKWFEILMGGENIKVKLGRDFIPLIIQDGYDQDFLCLSGGERTACALAYRISLNQVINDVVSFVDTSDLIILDEPTDGFSSEQLNRMRDVLNKLDVKQIIIVSHEEKMESFCNRIIRVEKREGESFAVSRDFS